MKVWLINHYSAHMEKDRAGRHYWFAKELKNRGYSVTVFGASRGPLSSTSCYQESNGCEVPFVIIKTRQSADNGAGRIKEWFDFYIHLFPAAKKYAEQYEKPDVIIASSVHPLTMIAGIQLAKRFKIPCICEVRDLWPEAIFRVGRTREDHLLGKLLVKGEHWIYKKSDAMIYTKEGDIDYIKEKSWNKEQGGDIDLDKCYYINNGVDLDDFDKRIETEQLKDRDLLDPEKFNITYTGTIRPVNNVGNILDCALFIKDIDQYNDIQFLIYGDGMEFEKLRKRVDEENISNVKLKGRVDRKFVPFILSRSSVNILNYSSTQYNWSRGNSSNKLFEYMASGKPILSTVKMGYSIIEKYQCGTEIANDTPKALAEAVIGFYRMPKEEYERMAGNARSGAQDFDFKKLTDKLETVIMNVIKGATSND